LAGQKEVKQGLRDLSTPEKQFMSFFALTTEGQAFSTQDHDQLVMRKFLPFFTLLGLFYPFFYCGWGIFSGNYFLFYHI
jgi:hypothetical protein